MIERVKVFIKRYWREIAVVVMFFILQAGINDAESTANRAYRYAADAADYAAAAADYAAEARDYSADASDNASDAADNSYYCRFR